ncbi:MAG: hypothetical protein Q8O19_01215 [Rectinemataceae bacterium]|nr:hypothetical protein [Rectinemataceae bacterium]
MLKITPDIVKGVTEMPIAGVKNPHSLNSALEITSVLKAVKSSGTCFQNNHPLADFSIGVSSLLDVLIKIGAMGGGRHQTLMNLRRDIGILIYSTMQKLDFKNINRRVIAN